MFGGRRKETWTYGTLVRNISCVDKNGVIHAGVSNHDQYFPHFAVNLEP